MGAVFVAPVFWHFTSWRRMASDNASSDETTTTTLPCSHFHCMNFASVCKFFSQAIGCGPWTKAYAGYEMQNDFHQYYWGLMILRAPPFPNFCWPTAIRLYKYKYNPVTMHWNCAARTGRRREAYFCELLLRWGEDRRGEGPRSKGGGEAWKG